MATTFTCIPQLGKSGGGKVWDPETNRVLAAFDADGLFTTSDKAVIAKLKKAGYKTVTVPDAPEDAPDADAAPSEG